MKPDAMQSNGVWSQWQADTYHQSSPKLAEFMAHYLPKDKNVIDMGCGNGFYIGELAKQGFNCLGIEGCPLNNFLHDQIEIMDLTLPHDLPVRGSVISLEVIEHIDKQYEQIFLDTVTRHCSGDLIFSWALTGQPGIGHVNCVDQSYAIDQIVKRGFKFLPGTTQQFRKHIDENCNWFERTLLIFHRKQSR